MATNGPTTNGATTTNGMPHQNEAPSEDTHALYSLSILAYKKADMDNAAYHKYMTENHAASVKDLMAEKGIVSYTIQHNTPPTTHPIMTRIFGSFYKNNIADYDCIIQIVFRSPDDFLAVKNDPHYQKVVLPDHGKFADTGRTVMVTGWYEEFVSGGRVV